MGDVAGRKWYPWVQHGMGGTTGKPWLSALIEHAVGVCSSWAATAHLASATREGDFALMADREPPVCGTRQCSAFEQ